MPDKPDHTRLRVVENNFQRVTPVEVRRSDIQGLVDWLRLYADEIEAGYLPDTPASMVVAHDIDGVAHDGSYNANSLVEVALFSVGTARAHDRMKD